MPSSTTIKWGNTSKTIKAQGVGNINLVFTSTQQLVKSTNVIYVPVRQQLGSTALHGPKRYSMLHSSIWEPNSYIPVTVPDLGVNLLSLSPITSKNYSLSFNKESCFIKTPKKAVLAKGSYKEGVSVFSATSSMPIKAVSYTKTFATINTFNNLEV